MSQHTVYFGQGHLDAMTSAANSIGAEMQKKIAIVEAQRDELLAALKLARDDAGFHLGKHRPHVLEAMNEAIAKAVQPAAHEK